VRTRDGTHAIDVAGARRAGGEYHPDGLRDVPEGRRPTALRGGAAAHDAADVARECRDFAKRLNYAEKSVAGRAAASVLLTPGSWVAPPRRTPLGS
jgi:hypothetical protein